MLFLYLFTKGTTVYCKAFLSWFVIAHSLKMKSLIYFSKKFVHLGTSPWSRNITTFDLVINSSCFNLYLYVLNSTAQDTGNKNYRKETLHLHITSQSTHNSYMHLIEKNR